MPATERRSNTPESVEEASLLCAGLEEAWTQHVEFNLGQTRPNPARDDSRYVRFEPFHIIRARLKREQEEAEQQRPTARTSAFSRFLFARRVAKSLSTLRRATSRTAYRLKDFVSGRIAAIKGPKKHKDPVSSPILDPVPEPEPEPPQYLDTATPPEELPAIREMRRTPSIDADDSPFRWTRRGYRETGDAELIFGEDPVAGYQQTYRPRPIEEDFVDGVVDIQLGATVELTLWEFRELVGRGR